MRSELNISSLIIVAAGFIVCLLFNRYTAYDASDAMYVLLALGLLIVLRHIVTQYRIRKGYFGNNEYEVRSYIESNSGDTK